MSTTTAHRRNPTVRNHCPDCHRPTVVQPEHLWGTDSVQCRDCGRVFRQVVPTQCPRCGDYYTDRPALSREDNTTPICPPCGTAEAMSDFYASQGAGQ